MCFLDFYVCVSLQTILLDFPLTRETSHLHLSEDNVKLRLKNVAKCCQQNGAIEFPELISLKKHQFEKPFM